MDEAPRGSNSSLDLSMQRRVDAVCLAFEEALRAGGEPPRIEQYLGKTAEPEYSALLRELLALELEYRRRNGESPTCEEYHLRFPNHGELIRAVWSIPAAPDSQEATGGCCPPVLPDGAEIESPAEAGREMPTFPGYDVLGSLGGGNMGVVYKARQVLPNRLVALKVIRAGNHATPGALARFHVEAEAVGRLQHPNIVQIYQVAEQAGTPYISLEFVGGGDLAQRLASGLLPAREAATLILTLARAMHSAHGCGIVHRDLKPSNVLLTVEGVPKIADFGLAKLLNQSNALTETGLVMGTPSYMAPEQADGRSKDAGPAADIYALGAILYELLTGRPPFRAETVRETLEQVRTREPERPKRFNPKLDAELEAVCLKCLEKEPQRRYGSARLLAEDLERWLTRRPTRARPRGRRARIQRFLRRHYLISLLAILLGFSASAAAIVSYMTSPARAREAVEKDLIEGQTVTLVGEAGLPRIYQPRTNAAELKMGVAEDGVFSVETFSLGLVELLPNLPVARYRFRAQMRQDDWGGAGVASKVGVYFAYRCEESDSGKGIHCYCSLEFKDLKDMKKIDRASAVTGKPVELTLQRYAESKEGPWLRTIRLYKPFPFHPHAWRTVAVEVTGGGVRAFWEGEPIGELTFTEIRKSTEMQLRMNSLTSPPASPEFRVRGGLGLYVFKGKASFRSVEIDPL